MQIPYQTGDPCHLQNFDIPFAGNHFRFQNQCPVPAIPVCNRPYRSTLPFLQERKFRLSRRYLKFRPKISLFAVIIILSLLLVVVYPTLHYSSIFYFLRCYNIRRGERTVKPLKQKISITIDSDILEKIKEKAEYDDRSLSQYINLVLKKHLEKEEEK